MYIKDYIYKNRNAFTDLCELHNVKTIYAFGSSVTDRFDETSSDIDILVELDYKDPLQTGEALISLWDQLEKFFRRNIDLLTEFSIKNPYLKKNIYRTRILLYDGNRKEILV